MDLENTSIQVRAALKSLSTFAYQKLENDNLQPTGLYPRKSYNYGLFIMSQSLLDGFITLSKKGQVRDMSILLRTLQEAWVNAFFTYSGPTHIWVYYLMLKSERSNLKKLKNLYLDGLGDEAVYLKKQREYDSLTRFIKRRYPVLPVIPGVIKANGDRDIETREINLRQQCQIIDFYTSGNIKGTFVRNYETVYTFLSETVHVSPRGINTLFFRNGNGGYDVDISGGKDRRMLIIIMINGFLYHYDLMKNYISSISNDRVNIPDELKVLKRQMIRLAQQVARS